MNTFKLISDVYLLSPKKEFFEEGNEFYSGLLDIHKSLYAVKVSIEEEGVDKGIKIIITDLDRFMYSISGPDHFHLIKPVSCSIIPYKIRHEYYGFVYIKL